MKRCPYCEEQFFDGDEEYENHLRMHESGMRLAYDEKRDGNIERVLACKVCEKTFQSGRGFAHHQQKGKTVYNCQECQKKFCNQFDLSKHLRADHVIIEDAVDFDMANPICPETGFESTEGYRNEFDHHFNVIASRTKKSLWHMIVNKQLPIGFSYSDLRDLLLEVTTDITCAYKINISFGVMLYKGVEDVYRYFYPSNNSSLFELPFLVSNTGDMNKFFKKLVDKDVVEINYQRRPSSG